MLGRIVNHNAVIGQGFYILDLGAVDADDDQPGTFTEIRDIFKIGVVVQRDAVQILKPRQAFNAGNRVLCAVDDVVFSLFLLYIASKCMCG